MVDDTLTKHSLAVVGFACIDAALTDRIKYFIAKQWRRTQGGGLEGEYQID